MRPLFVLLLVCALAGVGSCSSSKPKVVTPLPPVDMRGRAPVVVNAQSDQFVPAAIIVTVGTKVTWKNVDSVTHNVKKSADVLNFGAPFGTDSFNPGQSYSFTFAKVGTFTYTCTIHAGMDGKVEVLAE